MSVLFSTTELWSNICSSISSVHSKRSRLAQSKSLQVGWSGLFLWCRQEMWEEKGGRLKGNKSHILAQWANLGTSLHAFAKDADFTPPTRSDEGLYFSLLKYYTDLDQNVCRASEFPMQSVQFSEKSTSEMRTCLKKMCVNHASSLSPLSPHKAMTLGSIS